MGMNYTTKNVQDVVNEVTRSFGDESGAALTTADIIRWINNGANEIVNRNNVLLAKSSTVTIANQADYTFPSYNIRAMSAIHYDGSQLPNMPFAQAEEQIFSQNPYNAPVLSGRPVLWYEFDGTITLWPTPTSVAALDLYYVPEPAFVTVVGDLLPFPDSYFQAITTFVMRCAYEMTENWQGANLKDKQFNDICNGMADSERSSQNETYATMTVYDL